MEILAGIRLDELRTLCDARLLRLQAIVGDAGGVGELNPGGGQSRQGFRRTRGSPASAAACRANNAMGVIRRYFLKPAQVLSDILFLSFSTFQASRSRSWALSRA